MIKECIICGKLFMAKRSDAVCCSDACRQRKRRRGIYDEPPKTATENDAEGIVDRAHAVAVDMSRIAMFSPMPLAASLGRIAGRIEEALRSEGL